ncbi:restriction endonuclease, partial [Acinetobacter baumannii]
MNIEICTPNSATTKDKGDLLEKLSKNMLEAQNYHVDEEVRKTGSELDLLCKHNVSKKKIYVECKAYRDKKIDATIIRQLLGTVVFEDYDEGWLIGTSDFSKDAKGLCEELPNRPHGNRVIIYTPKDIVQSLQSSRIISNIPKEHLESYIDLNKVGEWYLLITSFGIFWAVTILNAGIPTNVICYHAKTGTLVEDQALLDNIASTDCSLSKLDFSKLINTKKDIKSSLDSQIEVVEVQRGEDWNDYRPARPQDFVGRTKDIKEIFDFFKKIREKEIGTRIFAITGNSGLGKSSLIITLSEKAKNLHQKKKLFLYAIDVRAAKSPDYIYSALLKTLKEAQKKGFGNSKIDLQITNVNHPLESESIAEYLNSLNTSKQLIVLVFDQFEELFSKPDLLELFNNASNILLDAASLKANLCIGFAWKTDSTMPSEHNAYFFWHRLSDYRIVRKLNPFSDRESHAVINKFEEVIGEKIHSDLRHNLIVSSQGYPWLLKKLCIHLHEKILSGQKQEDLLDNKLDISSLFASDLEELNSNEIKALKFIAQKAPVDLVDTIDTCGEDIVTSLLHKRLIIKSGIRLNIYWDIFREYILTETVPIISLRYLPSNDFSTIWNVVKYLSKKPISIQQLQEKTDFSEGTIQNIGTDVLLFGLATRENSQYVLSEDLLEEENTQENILNIIREKFKKHIITLH